MSRIKEAKEHGMTNLVSDAERQALEVAGWVYCHACPGWYDDTGCWDQDHSRHCGHKLKPPGADAGTMVLVCRHGGKAL